MENDTILCKIAEELESTNDDVHPRKFKLDGKWWCIFACFQFQEDVIQVMKLYRNHPKSKIKFVEINGQLVATYRRTRRPGVDKEHLNFMAKLFPIIFKNYSSSCDSLPLENDSDEDSGKQNQKLMKKYITTKLYDALYNKHQSVTAAVPTTPLNLPECFRPKLCRYQERTVEWLLKREKQTERIPALYVKLEARDGVSTVYKHIYDDLDLQIEEPPGIELAPGGILADEMGLGKTVEMLALILLHTRQMPSIVHPSSKYLDLDDVVLAKRRRRETTLFCICVSKSTRDLVQCSKCLQCQHVRCVSKYNAQHEAANEPYLCPSCWNELTQLSLLPTRATFIVSPHPIKMQWLSEIQRHINPSLSVLLYEGVADGRWISPAQLADYDIVLTDYNVLRGEVYHTSDTISERVCRQKPRSMRVQTPLLMVEWWRVCLDEAQMVESNTSKVAALVRTLPAVNRWGVTGTPIQRSIDDLCPLLLFIGFHEACESQRIWDNLVNEFMLHQEEPHRHLMLISLLQKCMWRTGKDKVIDELQIPPQSELVHHIDLSNLERLFYTEQHADCESNFNETIDKHIKRSQTQRVATISPQIMKLILQPLLKIRQCCNTPVVSGSKKNNALMLQKQFLQPKDLLTHLKTANELECKSQLRSMASSYNGMAAIYFIRQNYSEAIRHYELVLKLASDYKEMHLSVDSLLQIHALHNILQAHFTAPKETQHLSDASIEKYEQQCNNLEWKYLETYASTLKGVQSDFQVAKDALQAIESQTAANILEFLSQLLQTVVDEQAYLNELLINKIFDDCRTQFATNAKLAEMHSINGILYTINVWFGKVTKAQKKLDGEFKNLNFFTDNIRSRNQVDSGIWRQMMQFISSVYDCHLSKIREKQNDDETATTANHSNRKKPLCKLCQIREVLDGYECLLFDKVIDKNTNQMEGLANPSLEVHIIKVILTFMKSKLKNRHLAPLIEKYTDSIELMLTSCKKLIKYWIEIEYTVKAYDELDMCRMRISLADNKDEESIYRISEYEIDDILTEQQFNLHSAQRQFVLKLARLKYIMHLETDADPGPCPICHSEDQAKYVVLECGHHICFPCLKTVLEYAKYRNLTCSICRNHQSSKKIYFVTRSTTHQDADLEVKGNYSSKIMHIVRLILKLKREHSERSQPTPKILIFSQWQPILNALATALCENDVLHRLYSPRSVEEFKESGSAELGITCLLMVLSKGSKGLNLIEATHVFLVEPILNPGEELQAIGRVHRFGQTQPTTVHRFIVRNTIEENVFNVVAAGRESQENWEFSNMTLESLRNLFQLQNDLTVEYTNSDTGNITGPNTSDTI